LIAPFHHTVLLQREQHSELVSGSHLVAVLDKELGAEFVVAVYLQAAHLPNKAALALTRLIASNASSLARISTTHMKWL
jgi:hypothetical protein